MNNNNETTALSSNNTNGMQSVAASPQWKPNKTKQKGFSPFVAFCFTINYILGTGFLTIPWAFIQGGLLLSSLLLIVCCILSDVTKGYILECMSRAEVMLDNDMRWVPIKPGDEEKQLLVYSPVRPLRDGDDGYDDRVVKSDHNLYDLGDDDEENDDNKQPLMKKKNQFQKDYQSFLSGTPILPGTPGSKRRVEQAKDLKRNLVQISKPKYVVKNRKFEINALCRIFLGKPGLHLYTIFLCMYIYCTLWAYTCVFASSLSKAAPITTDPERNYTYYACIFACIVVPMSCLELEEQVIVQVLLTICRFLMVSLMIFTSTNCDHPAQNDYDLVNFNGLHKMLPIIVFATIYHHSIPGLSNPVADKKKLGTIFRCTNIFSCSAYIFIGCVLGSIFGNNIQQSSNLHWESYTTGNNGTYDYIISWFVLCFPAIDVCSAFPLCAITLGNNVLGTVFGRRVHEVEKNRWIVVQFRLLACIPPILQGILIRELGTITDYAGTVGFLITFSFPAILYINSYYKAISKHFSEYTYYSNYSSNVYIAALLFLFGIALFLYVGFLIFREQIVSS